MVVVLSVIVLVRDGGIDGHGGIVSGAAGGAACDSIRGMCVDARGSK